MVSSSLELVSLWVMNRKQLSLLWPFKVFDSSATAPLLFFSFSTSNEVSGEVVDYSQGSEPSGASRAIASTSTWASLMVDRWAM